LTRISNPLKIKRPDLQTNIILNEFINNKQKYWTGGGGRAAHVFN